MRPYPYVYINADGSARELHASEMRYLETEFAGGDGAMPSIKAAYAARDGWGDLKGYLKRSALPARIAVGAAPAEDPLRAFSRDERIAWLRSKGVEAVEQSDGSLTLLPRVR